MYTPQTCVINVLSGLSWGGFGIEQWIRGERFQDELTGGLKLCRAVGRHSVGKASDHRLSGTGDLGVRTQGNLDRTIGYFEGVGKEWKSGGFIQGGVDADASLWYGLGSSVLLVMMVVVLMLMEVPVLVLMVQRELVVVLVCLTVGVFVVVVGVDALVVCVVVGLAVMGVDMVVVMVMGVIALMTMMVVAMTFAMVMSVIVVMPMSVTLAVILGVVMP